MNNTLSPQEYFQQLEKKTDNFENWVGNTYIKPITRDFIMSVILTVIVPIGIAVIAGFVAGFAAILTTIGVGVINAGEKITRGKDILLKYGKDRSVFERITSKIRGKLIMAEGDMTKLAEVEDLLRKSVDAMP
jgi:hypothetical protein